MRLFHGAGDGHQSLKGIVEDLCGRNIGGRVVNLLAISAADDQTGIFQLLQVMGDGRTGHPHHHGKIGDTFFAVAQYPKQPQTAAVAELFEDIRKVLKFFDLRQGVKQRLNGLTVIVGQMGMGHCFLSFTIFYIIA